MKCRQGAPRGSSCEKHRQNVAAARQVMQASTNLADVDSD